MLLMQDTDEYEIEIHQACVSITAAGVHKLQKIFIFSGLCEYQVTPVPRLKISYAGICQFPLIAVCRCMIRRRELRKPTIVE
jgi:hypothetical protein